MLWNTFTDFGIDSSRKVGPRSPNWCLKVNTKQYTNQTRTPDSDKVLILDDSPSLFSPSELILFSAEVNFLFQPFLDE